MLNPVFFFCCRDKLLLSLLERRALVLHSEEPLHHFSDPNTRRQWFQASQSYKYNRNTIIFLSLHVHLFTLWVMFQGPPLSLSFFLSIWLSLSEMCIDYAYVTLFKQRLWQSSLSIDVSINPNPFFACHYSNVVLLIPHSFQTNLWEEKKIIRMWLQTPSIRFLDLCHLSEYRR